MYFVNTRSSKANFGDFKKLFDQDRFDYFFLFYLGETRRALGDATLHWQARRFCRKNSPLLLLPVGLS